MGTLTTKQQLALRVDDKVSVCYKIDGKIIRYAGLVRQRPRADRIDIHFQSPDGQIAIPFNPETSKLIGQKHDGCWLEARS